MFFGGARLGFPHESVGFDQQCLALAVAGGFHCQLFPLRELVFSAREIVFPRFDVFADVGEQLALIGKSGIRTSRGRQRVGVGWRIHDCFSRASIEAFGRESIGSTWADGVVDLIGDQMLQAASQLWHVRHSTRCGPA